MDVHWHKLGKSLKSTINGWLNKKSITLLRVIPTMTFIHFLTGKSSGILSDISSGILSGISSGICSGISSGIFSGILSGKSSGILSGISSGILSDISSGILSGISSGILSDISSGILSDIPSGISSGILSGRWGPAVPTGIWSSWLRSGSAHWDLELVVEVRQCPLGSGARGGGPAVPTGIWTARRRRRVRRRRRQRRRRRRRRRALLKSSNPHLAGGELWMENLQVPVLISKEWEIPRGHDYHDWIARSEGTMTRKPLVLAAKTGLCCKWPFYSNAVNDESRVMCVCLTSLI